MNLIKFRDTCTIVRGTGEVDCYDNPIEDAVYEGQCLYEEGGKNWSSDMVTRTPTVFLPGNDVLVSINDRIQVTTESGREIRAYAKSVRDVRLRVMQTLDITKIELKQAFED